MIDKQQIRDLEAAIDRAGIKNEQVLGEIWKTLKAINVSLQDIVDAIGNIK